MILSPFSCCGRPRRALVAHAARPRRRLRLRPRPPSITRGAREAYDRGDMPGFLQGSTEAARLRPGDVWMLYNLACAQARNGQTRAAVETLAAIAAHRVGGDLSGDADLDSIRNDDGYKDVVAKMAALKAQRITSGAKPAFIVAEKGLVPEGVAYDPKTRAFFLASIRQRKILRIGADGRVSEFVSARDGLLRHGDGRGFQAPDPLGGQPGDAAHDRLQGGRSAGVGGVRVRRGHRPLRGEHRPPTHPRTRPSTT